VHAKRIIGYNSQRSNYFLSICTEITLAKLRILNLITICFELNLQYKKLYAHIKIDIDIDVH